MADLGREPHLKERSDAQMCVNRLCRNTVPYCSTLPDIYEYRSFGRGVLLSSESQYLSPRNVACRAGSNLANGLHQRTWKRTHNRTVNENKDLDCCICNGPISKCIYDEGDVIAF